jgi:hypothetical protein
MAGVDLTRIGRLNFPLRIMRGGKSRLIYEGKGEDPLIFGNIYRGTYTQPFGKEGSNSVRANKLPLHDLYPLLMFLEHQLTSKTLLALNLHFTVPATDVEDSRNPNNPSGSREVLIGLVNAIKKKIQVIGDIGDIEGDFFTENNIDYEGYLRNEVQLTSAQEAKIDALILDSVKNKRSIDWGTLTKVENKFIRLLPTCFRRYSVVKLRWDQIDAFRPEVKQEILTDIPDTIRLYTPLGYKAWNDKDIKTVSIMAMQNKNWYQYIRQRQGLSHS